MAITAKQLAKRGLNKNGRSELKMSRLRHGLQLQAVAAIIDIDYSFLSMLENGKRKPSFDVARKLAKFYETTIEELFP